VKIDPRDPFGERIEPCSRVRVNVLGADVSLESSDVALMNLALDAYGGLPGLRVDRDLCNLHVSMVLNDNDRSWQGHEIPPPPLLSSGGGILCAAIDAGNFAVVDPANARALICVSRALLDHDHIARYELIEFAILTLAARNQSLVPLHGACIGIGDAGCLIVGASGAGKSSLCLLGLQNGMFVLSEDSTFVDPSTMQILGAPNFLHVRAETQELLDPGTLREQLARSPIIERRSGSRKFALNLRDCKNELPSRPLRLTATVFVVPQSADAQSALQPCDPADVLSRLEGEQPYAAGLPEWRDFCRHLSAVPCYELRRTQPPEVAVNQLRALFD